MPPRRSVSEGRRERAHELGTLQPMPQPLEAVPESGSDGYWKSAGDERGGDPSLGKIQAQAGAAARASTMNTEKEEQYHAVIAGQKKDLDQLRAQLELLKRASPWKGFGPWNMHII